MTCADPWDEITRLEEAMEAELSAHLEAARPSLPDVGERVEVWGNRVEKSSSATSKG